MSNKIKKMICKYFGHQEVEEVFAVRCCKKYDGVSKTICIRCGEVLEEKPLFKQLSRAELLNRGWFIYK